MRKFVISFLFLLLGSFSAMAQKQIYIPDSLKDIDLTNPNSRWSWTRSSQTDNLIFFWEKGFGDDTKHPPMLQGHPMGFDLEHLKERVEQFYQFFRDSLQFTRPGSKADRYKMMVMINYSLDGTAYGGTYDNFIGALWVATNRIQDQQLNCLAHELGHSFQLQIPADSVGEAWGGSGFFEMTSQWMLWQVNPNWIADEYYHFEAFRKQTHKTFLSLDNIYHSPYVIEYWAEKHGKPFIAQLYREGRIGEDPVMTYMRLNKLTQSQFNEELFEGYIHLLNFGFKHAYAQTRPYACTFSTPMKQVGKHTWRIPTELAPEEYGFNAIKLSKTGRRPQVYMKRLSPDNGCDLRYQLVEEAHCWYLLVMNAPQQHRKQTAPQEAISTENMAQRPTITYQVTLKGAEILP